MLRKQYQKLHKLENQIMQQVLSGIEMLMMLMKYRRGFAQNVTRSVTEGSSNAPTFKQTHADINRDYRGQDVDSNARNVSANSLNLITKFNENLVNILKEKEVKNRSGLTTKSYLK